jgi:hypothetical protein
MYALFHEFRARHESDDAVLDTMDIISGWYGPSARLFGIGVAKINRRTFRLSEWLARLANESSQATASLCRLRKFSQMVDISTNEHS